MSVGSSVNNVLKHIGLSIDRWPPPNSVKRHLRELFPDLGVDCVFDVGANKGQFAEMLREIGFDGHIVSFEPNQELYQRLVAASAGDARWSVRSDALGDVEDTAVLHVSEADDLASVLTISDYAKASFGAAADVVRSESVSVRRLDGLYEGLRQEIGFSHPFLKMDTQGYDLQVLRGAEGCRAGLAGLMTEMSLQPLYVGMPSMAESLAAVREAGFDVTGLYPVVSDGSRRLIEVDCVARRAN